jgi:hypothetical protein
MSANMPHTVPAPHDDDADDVGPFVLNLCAVRSPLAIPQPRARNLVKYAFFVSRGREVDRERFWLHMGYFESRDEAQKWLSVLHPIYPLAFVTPAAVTFVPFDDPAAAGAAPRPE